MPTKKELSYCLFVSGLLLPIFPWFPLLPIESKYIFLSFCLELCKNKYLLDLPLSKRRSLGEDHLLNASFQGMKLFRNLRFITQVDDFHPFCLLRTNYSEIPQVISPVELHLSSTVICNLSSRFILANWGGPY